MAAGLKIGGPTSHYWGLYTVADKSVYDLTYTYLTNLPSDIELTEEKKKSALNEMKDLLDRGYIAEDIENLLFNSNIQSLPAITRLLRNRNENLLKSDMFYWHPQLRLFPKAPKRVLDYNTGTISKIDEPYFLEMKASYTLEDLAYYYCSQMNMDYKGNAARCVGAFKHILSKHSLDTTLFMIDAAANHIHEGDKRPLDSPLAITDFLHEAQGAIGEKMTEEVQAGDDKIVYRRRVPLGGSRSEVEQR